MEWSIKLTLYGEITREATQDVTLATTHGSLSANPILVVQPRWSKSGKDLASGYTE